MSELTDAFDELERIIGGIEREIKELRAENQSLQEQLTQAEDDNNELTIENEKYRDRPDTLDAIFLNVVARPTGQLVYTVPRTTEANRAILGLFDAINRNP